MAAIDAEIQALKDNLIDMLELVRKQLVRCKKAIGERSRPAAGKVIRDEMKVNSQELAIDRDCENIIALYNPVATDLRFVLSSLRITNELERIGDNASKLATFIMDNAETLPAKWLDKYELEGMLDTLIDMLTDMGTALRTGEPAVAVEAAKKDKELNKLFKKAFKTTSSLIAEESGRTKDLLALFAITRDLERAGDRTKNIAEEIVFHLEAKVVKHKRD